MVFYLGWAQGFPRKNRVFRILFCSTVLNCSLPSQEQAARTGAVAVCEKLATTFKNTIHPPLVFCTHNPNRPKIHSIRKCPASNRTQLEYTLFKLSFIVRKTYWTKNQPTQNRPERKITRPEIEPEPNLVNLNMTRIEVNLNRTQTE